MIQMMTTTLQAAGLGRAGNTGAVSPASIPRVAGALRRAVGFAITAGGFAVIAAHALHRAVGG